MDSALEQRACCLDGLEVRIQFGLGAKCVHDGAGFWIDDAHQAGLAAIALEEFCESQFFRLSRRRLCAGGVGHIKLDPMNGAAFLLTECFQNWLDALARSVEDPSGAIAARSAAPVPPVNDLIVPDKPSGGANPRPTKCKTPASRVHFHFVRCLLGSGREAAGH